MWEHYLIIKLEPLLGRLESYICSFENQKWKPIQIIRSARFCTNMKNNSRIPALKNALSRGKQRSQMMNNKLYGSAYLPFVLLIPTAHPLFTISISMFFLQQCIHLRISFNILSLNGNLKRQMEICTMSYGCDSCDSVMLRIQNNLFTHSLTTFLFVP